MNFIKKTFALILALGLTHSPLFAENIRLFNSRPSEGPLLQALPGQVLVKYKKGVSQKAKIKMAGKWNSTSIQQMDGIGVELLKVPSGHTVESFIQLLQNDPNVEFAEPNGLVRTNLFADDMGSQYYLQSNTAAGINIQEAWDVTTGNPNTVVAVLDTGVTLTHPDLDGNLWDDGLGNAGVTIFTDLNGDGDANDSFADAGSEMPGNTNPVDDNNLGTSPSTGLCVPDSIYHGTHVAGIIAAETNNGQNIAGICQNCQIMAVKVLNNCGVGTFAAIGAGIEYAVNNGASVINMSLGGPFNSATMDAAVKNAVQNNVVVVAATGNSGHPCPVNFPAAIDEAIAVGSINSSGELSDFSCSGSKIDLVAPGEGILSTSQSGTSALSGTSFAAPIVAGIAALIRSIDPNMPVLDVTRYIDFNATPVGGVNKTFGFGKANAQTAVEAANAGTPLVSNPADTGKTFPYPNPFNPTLGSAVNISLPESIGSSNIKIEIYNLQGQKIKTISGTNSWDGKNSDGKFVASGLYLYFVETDGGNAKGKITLIK